MSTPFDGFKSMSFSGIPFPYKSYKIQGAIRKHEHQFPHTDGGINEKLGRKLYEFHVSSRFTADLKGKYQDLLGDLEALRGVFEKQKTAQLYVPHIGEIMACAESWTETANSNNRSTIDVDMVFFEDQDAALLFKIREPSTRVSIANAVTEFDVQRIRLELLTSKNSSNVFSLINNTAASILAIKDQLDLYGSLVIAKIDGFTALLKQTDRQVKELNDPDFLPLLNALHDMWFASVQLQRDVENTSNRLRIYTTPVRMSVSQISSALYGSTYKAADLMQLNALDDPLSIPAGTKINFYAQGVTEFAQAPISGAIQKK